MEDSKLSDGDALKLAIRRADPYGGRGTSYLHILDDRDKEREDGNSTGAVVVPISLATTFQQRSPGEATARGDPNSFGKGYEYSRTGNPTRGAFERAMAAAENAQYCVAFASGSAATSAVVHLVNSGDHVLCVDDVYGGTQRYFRRVVQPSYGVKVDFCDMSEGKIPFKENTKLVWLETPTNPTLKITDIAMLSRASRSKDCILAVDNTFCSPYFQSPLDLGADLVVHSVTKYIGGHSDVVMGVVVTNSSALYERLRFIQNGVGAVPSPFDCFLAHRGLKTLHVRMEAAARNAFAIALFLERHAAVRKVLYPGLTSHPQHELAKRQQHGFGAMITFYCIGGRDQASLFIRSLRLFALAESLGAVESLAESPSLMTHASVPDDQRRLLGIDDTLIRLSIGIETCGDLIKDLDQALGFLLENKGGK